MVKKWLSAYCRLAVLLGVILIAAPCAIRAQGRPFETTTTLGLQLKFLFPLEILNISDETFGQDDLTYTVNAPTGLAMGMPLRINFADMWSFETGIYFTRRNFSLSIDDELTGYTESTDFTVVGYEIPLQGIIQLQTGTRTWANVGLGGSFDFYASDVTTEGIQLETFSVRKNWVQMAVIGTAGVEYRTEEDGTLYFGFSYHRPANDIMDTQVNYFRSPTDVPILTGFLDGTYVSADLRYYFPVRKDTKPKIRRVVIP